MAKKEKIYVYLSRKPLKGDEEKFTGAEVIEALTNKIKEVVNSRFVDDEDYTEEVETENAEDHKERLRQVLMNYACELIREFYPSKPGTKSIPVKTFQRDEGAKHIRTIGPETMVNMYIVRNEEASKEYGIDRWDIFDQDEMFDDFRRFVRCWMNGVID